MKQTLVIITAVLLASLATLHSASASKPNILIILADDMGFSDLGCYGGEIATPNLDRLAAGGLRFTSFYNSAKCEPTRASLMSGQYWQDCGLGVKRGLTMGQAMKPAGYDTFAVGKWHLDGNPVERGFDHYFGHLGGGSDYFKGSRTHRLDDKPFVPANDGKFYTTDANADYAIKFIGEAHAQNPGRPFFTYLAFNAPHASLQAWPEDIAKYRGKYRIGWDKLREQRYQKQIELGITKKEWTLSPRPDTIPAWDSLTDAEKDFEDARMSVYAAQVDRMDQAIGRVLAKVKELGEKENTLVIFLSDNGASPYDHGKVSDRRIEPLLAGTSHLGYGLGWANVSETPFRHYKRNMFNGGSSTACIASWPAVVAHSGDWKLIRIFHGGDQGAHRHLLFNLRDDLGERNNLAAKEPARVIQLDALIEKFLTDTKAVVPIANPKFDPAKFQPELEGKAESKAKGAKKAAAKAPAPTDAKPDAIAAGTDPLQGWKARSCTATVNAGVVTVTGQGAAPFLGVGAGVSGPATVKVRVRSAAGGSGKVEWLPAATAATDSKSTPFTLAPGDWQECSVNIPATGSLGILRLYLPAQKQPVEVDWIELKPEGKPKRRSTSQQVSSGANASKFSDTVCERCRCEPGRFALRGSARRRPNEPAEGNAA